MTYEEAKEINRRPAMHSIAERHEALDLIAKACDMAEEYEQKNKRLGETIRSIEDGVYKQAYEQGYKDGHDQTYMDAFLEGKLARQEEIRQRISELFEGWG